MLFILPGYALALSGLFSLSRAKVGEKYKNEHIQSSIKKAKMHFI